MSEDNQDNNVFSLAGKREEKRQKRKRVQFGYEETRSERERMLDVSGDRIVESMAQDMDSQEFPELGDFFRQAIGTAHEDPLRVSAMSLHAYILCRVGIAKKEARQELGEMNEFTSDCDLNADVGHNG